MQGKFFKRVIKARPRLLRYAAVLVTFLLGYYFAANRPIDTNWLFPALVVGFLVLGGLIRPPHSR